MRIALSLFLATRPAVMAADTARITGDLKLWHKVTLTVTGPSATESDTRPNPFTDYRMTVRFEHESGKPSYDVPGYFAADGSAGETSASSGDQWRAHLSPDKPGRWNWSVSFRKGEHVAVTDAEGEPVANVDGLSGAFEVQPSDAKGRDFRAHGRLQYVGGHYLRFAGSGEYFLKAGPDAPETLLAYADFDGTRANAEGQPARRGEARPTGLKTWQPHVQDWSEGDPVWKNGKGKGLIGALNYIAGTGCNAFSFLPYNSGGDGDNVWPFIERDAKLQYDCSKLDQWGIVFDHATTLGLYLHFKLQEQEIDDNRTGQGENTRDVPVALDGGDLGIERKLYLRELIARFGHALALNWNLGEENTQSPEQQRAMAAYIKETDPYDHHIVVHTFPGQQDKVYNQLIGDQSVLTGASLQNEWDVAHQRTLKWVRESARAGKPWVVANDEQGPANLGVPPDPGYNGFDGYARRDGHEYNLHDIRKQTLWGTLMAGGAGVEYYFGYQLPQNDLACQDWRSRAKSWEYCRVALDFFKEQKVPFWEMKNADELIGNSDHNNSRYCFAKPGELYLVDLSEGGEHSLDLSGASGTFSVRWLNPEEGGELQTGSVRRVSGGGKVSLGEPPSRKSDDWLAVVRKQ